jgi:hypothetical protein
VNESISGEIFAHDSSVKRGIARDRPRRRPARRFVIGLALVAVVAVAGLVLDAFVPHAYGQAAGKQAGPSGKKTVMDSEARAIQRLERAKLLREVARRKFKEAGKAFAKSGPGASLDAVLKARRELSSAEKEVKNAKKATLDGRVKVRDQRLKNIWKWVNKVVFSFREKMDRIGKQDIENLKIRSKFFVSRIVKLRKSLKNLEKRLWKWRKGWFRDVGADERNRKEAILTGLDLELGPSLDRILKRARARLDAKGRPDIEKVPLFIDEKKLKESGFTEAEIERYKRWKRLQLRLRILDALAAHRKAELERFIREIEAKIHKKDKKGKPKGKNDTLRSFVPHLPAIHPMPKPGIAPPMEPRFPASPPEPMPPR